jgi:DNA-binding Xre family transcriptional regulator
MGLSRPDKRAIGGDIKTVQYGWPLGMPVVRKMDHGLWVKPTWRNDMSKHIGGSFDDFLDEEGLRAEAEAIAIKRVIAFQLGELMKEQKLTKTRLAERMGTSRSALERLLDPDNASVTLLTLERAAKALGKHIRIELAA